MQKDKTQLNHESQQTLAEMYETKYFQVLEELIGEELEVTKTYMLNLGLTNEQLRFYQGRAEGLGVILLRIKKIHEELIEKPSKQ